MLAILEIALLMRRDVDAKPFGDGGGKPLRTTEREQHGARTRE